MEATLELRQCFKRFGGLTAIKNLDLRIGAGNLYGLIGPNGAGKTTVFNLITGIYSPDGGSITLDCRHMEGFSPHLIAGAGISRTFQNIRLFSDMSVLENVLVAFHRSRKQALLDAVFRTSRFHDEELRICAIALDLLERFQLRHLAHETAKNLPYGSQRKLEIVRALATSPKFLLLDEPAAGMNPQESMQLMHLIRQVRDDFGLGILLVEHNMKVVMGVCETIQVMDHGESIAVGTPDEIRRDAKVIEAYLGAME